MGKSPFDAYEENEKPAQSPAPTQQTATKSPFDAYEEQEKLIKTPTQTVKHQNFARDVGAMAGMGLDALNAGFEYGVRPVTSGAMASLLGMVNIQDPRPMGEKMNVWHNGYFSPTETYLERAGYSPMVSKPLAPAADLASALITPGVGEEAALEKLGGDAAIKALKGMAQPSKFESLLNYIGKPQRAVGKAIEGIPAVGPMARNTWAAIGNPVSALSQGLGAKLYNSQLSDLPQEVRDKLYLAGVGSTSASPAVEAQNAANKIIGVKKDFLKNSINPEFAAMSPEERFNILSKDANLMDKSIKDVDTMGSAAKKSKSSLMLNEKDNFWNNIKGAVESQNPEQIPEFLSNYKAEAGTNIPRITIPATGATVIDKSNPMAPLFAAQQEELGKMLPKVIQNPENLDSYNSFISDMIDSSTRKALGGSGANNVATGMSNRIPVVGKYLNNGGLNAAAQMRGAKQFLQPWSFVVPMTDTLKYKPDDSSQ